MRARTRSLLSSVAAVMLVASFAVVGCGDDSSKPEDVVSSLSYRGHENDFDSNALARAYPNIVGTRIDDCQACHAGGEVTDDRERTSALNPCSYCHLIPYPDTSLVAGVPQDYEATLNPFGLDYKNAGRNSDAMETLAGMDSDGDSHTNADELNNLRYPGDPDSRPGQPFLPIRTFGANELGTLEGHEQFLLMNSHKQQFDTYATYTGVKVKDLLEASGADLSSATSITFIAPDGYAKDFSLESLNAPYPAGLYFAGLDPGSFTDPDQGFVEYPESDLMPKDLIDGGEIPGEQWLMLASGRDANVLDESYLDPISGRMNGEGPYRLVVPQSVPGAPDRGSKYSPSGYSDGNDYDDSKDHNAGLCVRGIVAVRVNPIPDGYEEFDWKNGGWALIEKGEVIVYGAGVTDQ